VVEVAIFAWSNNGLCSKSSFTLTFALAFFKPPPPPPPPTDELFALSLETLVYLTLVFTVVFSLSVSFSQFWFIIDDDDEEDDDS
jgi:hypothetical protein